MANYHCHLSTFSRERGQSAVAAAAYRSGQPLRCAREGQTKYPHRARADIAFSQIVGWADSRELLWSSAELAENRKNACVARELLVALPKELDALQREHTALEYAHWLSETHKVPVDINIHKPRSRRGANENHHAHLLFPTREVINGVFEKKTRALDDLKKGPVEVERMRAKWEGILNTALRKAGLTIRVSRERSKSPRPKLSPAEAAMLRRREPDQAVSQTLQQLINTTSKDLEVQAEKETKPPTKSVEEAENTPIAGESILERSIIEQDRPPGNTQPVAKEPILSEEPTGSTDTSDATTTPPARIADRPVVLSSQPEQAEQVKSTSEEPPLPQNSEPLISTAPSQAPTTSPISPDDHQLTMIHQLQHPKASQTPPRQHSPTLRGMTPQQMRDFAEEISKQTGEPIEEVLQGLEGPLENGNGDTQTTESKPPSSNKNRRAPTHLATRTDGHSPRTIAELKRAQGAKAPPKTSFQQPREMTPQQMRKFAAQVAEDTGESIEDIMERMAAPVTDHEVAARRPDSPAPSKPRTLITAAPRTTIRPSASDEKSQSDAPGEKT